MKFTPLYAFTLTLTDDEVNGLLKELEEVNEKYWCDAFEDFFVELTNQVEFYTQYNKRSASALKDAIEAIPYDERGAMMNQLDYEISLTF
jgi:hypothetical protein